MKTKQARCRRRSLHFQIVLGLFYLCPSVVTLFLSGFFFQLFQLSGELFGLVVKSAEALLERGGILGTGRWGGSRIGSNYCLCRPRWRGSSRQIGQSLVEGIAINQPVAHRQNYLLELRHAGFIGLNVDRFHVKESSRHG